VEPYSDGSTLRCLSRGIDELTRPTGDTGRLHALYDLLRRLFVDTHPGLAAFLDTYQSERGRQDWSAVRWLETLHSVLFELLPSKEMASLRREWVTSEDQPEHRLFVRDLRQSADC
jgi:hypothetical protein